jgi:membrane fusion protein YbhG
MSATKTAKPARTGEKLPALVPPPSGEPALPAGHAASAETSAGSRPKERASENRQTARSETAPRTRRWRWIVGAVVLALMAGGTASYLSAPEETGPGELLLQGNIDVRQVNLSFKVDGRIETLAVDEGDSVKAGQVVATLDKRYFQDDLRVMTARRDSTAATLARLEHGSRPEEIGQARAQLEQQKATLFKSRQDFARAGRMLQNNAMSREDYDQVRAAQDVAQANVRYAEQTLKLAEIGPRQEDIDAAKAQLAEQSAAVIQSQRRLADSDLIAPNDGTILTRAREKGAIVQASETVFTLTLASPVWVRTYVNERDLGKIEPDMPATVTTDTAPNRPYDGHIGFISPTAEFTPKTVETRELRTDLVYRLRVIVENPDGGLRQGMPVTVSLPVGSARPRTFFERLFHLSPSRVQTSEGR